jgi:hypothetical protein
VAAIGYGHLQQIVRYHDDHARKIRHIALGPIEQPGQPGRQARHLDAGFGTGFLDARQQRSRHRAGKDSVTARLH